MLSIPCYFHLWSVLNLQPPDDFTLNCISWTPISIMPWVDNLAWILSRLFIPTHYYYVFFFLLLFILQLLFFLKSNLAFLITGSHIVFISMLNLLKKSLLPNRCAASLRLLILKVLLNLLSWLHPFSFHLWSAIPDYITSPQHTAFWCSPSLTFSWQHISLFYTLWRFRNYQRTPNWMLTRRLPDTKCINASPRIRLHASIRLKSEKRKIIKCKVANEKRSRQN